MPSVLFTDRSIQRLKPIPGHQIEVFDRKVRGLTIRVNSGGTKAFFAVYKMGGRNCRLGLGRYPAVSLAEARQRAREALAQVARGLDPATEKLRERKDYHKNLFPAVLEDFIENYAKRKTRSWRETERILSRGFGGPWRKLPVAQISKSTINYVLDGMISRPSAANRAFAAIRKFLNWCVERGYLEHSPCSGMKTPSKVISRDRVLSDDELLAVWLAADKMGYPFGRLVQLLLLTAQRRSEVGGMRWEEIDLLKAFWELPPGTETRAHKSNRRHNVPLGTRVLDMLKSLPPVHDDLVFPARGKDNPVSGFSKWKHKLYALSGVKNWILHDLGRTAATGMAGLGVPPHVVERILNHKTGVLGGVAGIYNRFAYQQEMSEALNQWSQHLENIICKAQSRSN